MNLRADKEKKRRLYEENHAVNRRVICGGRLSSRANANSHTYTNSATHEYAGSHTYTNSVTHKYTDSSANIYAHGNSLADEYSNPCTYPASYQIRGSPLRNNL
jgi:hypothetical protein